jgi:hypothetical protein
MAARRKALPLPKFTLRDFARLKDLFINYLEAEPSKPATIDPVSGASVLMFCWPLQAVGCAALIISAAALWALLFDNVGRNPANLILAIECGMVAAAALWLIAQATWGRIVIDGHSITSHSPFRSPRTLAWDDVVGVSYSSWRECFVVRAKDDERIWVSVRLTGVIEFVETVETRVPTALEASALGHPFFSTDSHS